VFIGLLKLKIRFTWFQEIGFASSADETLRSWLSLPEPKLTTLTFNSTDMESQMTAKNQFNQKGRLLSPPYPIMILISRRKVQLQQRSINIKKMNRT
jgi:hypothetical protein